MFISIKYRNIHLFSDSKGYSVYKHLGNSCRFFWLRSVINLFFLIWKWAPQFLRDTIAASSIICLLIRTAHQLCLFLSVLQLAFLILHPFFVVKEFTDIIIKTRNLYSSNGLALPVQILFLGRNKKLIKWFQIPITLFENIHVWCLLEDAKCSVFLHISFIMLQFV